jgi:hypothetical protein
LTVYANLDGTTPDKGLGALLKWKVVDRLASRRPRERVPFTTPRRVNDGRELASPDPQLTWIGHATFLARLGGKIVATDPIWSDRIHAIKRLAAPGVELEACPKIDVVTVSHSHYDHLDLPTLERDALYVVPRDNAELLAGAGLPDLDGTGSHPLQWVDPDEGFLALDLNGNGKIDNGTELFGNFTVIEATHLRAADGFEALAQYDRNQDHKIDAKDPVFDDLRIWFDKNQDGISRPEELMSVPGRGITAIHLDSTATQSDPTMNAFRAKVSIFDEVFCSPSATFPVGDVWFKTTR